MKLLCVYVLVFGVAGSQVPVGDVTWDCGSWDAAQNERAPWLVYIRWIRNSTRRFPNECFGTLISPNVVITHAYCANTLDDILVGTGPIGEYGKLVNPQDQISRVVLRAIHMEYNQAYSDGTQSQLALLDLKTPFNMTASVHPVCLNLDDASFNSRHLTPNTTGRAYYRNSWSSTEMDAWDSCRKGINKDAQWWNYHKSIGIFCMRSTQYICPYGVVFPQQGRWYLRGLIYRCLLRGNITVPTYTGLYHYRKWLLSTGAISKNCGEKLPWYLKIFAKDDKEQYSLKCNAALVSPRIVALSFSCDYKLMRSKDKYLVATGYLLTDGSVPVGSHVQVSQVGAIFKNPSFNAMGHYENNLILLHLKTSVGTSASMGPLCVDLRREGNTEGLLAPGAVTRGYGNRGCSDVSILDNATCRSRLDALNLEYIYSPSTFCTTRVNCSDGLVVSRREADGTVRWFLGGMHHFCANDMQVFTRLNAMGDWIKRVLNLQPNSYIYF